jgi:hypothetical protein
MKELLAKLIEPIDIIAKKITRKEANQIALIIVVGIFFIMIAIAYNIMTRGELPKTDRGYPESAK